MKFNIKRDYLALDFDGVVVNSVEECLVVAYNAFAEYFHGRKVNSVNEVEPETVLTFKQLRNFIRSGADFVYIILAISENMNINNQQEFDDFTNKYEDLRNTFFDLFYLERESFFTQKPESWIKLNPLYDGLNEFLSSYPYKERLYIITTKKIFFVKKILSFYGIQLIKNNLFTADDKKNKKDIIQELLSNHKISPQRFWFVDDQIDTLLKVKDSFIHCFLAEWGYNDEQQINKGKKENIEIITLKDFRNKFI